MVAGPPVLKPLHYRIPSLIGVKKIPLRESNGRCRLQETQLTQSRQVVRQGVC